MRNEKSGRQSEQGDEHAQPQDGSLKTHGDVLEPMIPRGADQKPGPDEEKRVSEEGPSSSGTRTR